MTAARTLYANKLQRLADASAEGLALSDLGIGTAIHMRLLGLATVHDERGRVTITRQGVEELRS